jgi:FkbM family methyltransferase
MKVDVSLPKLYSSAGYSLLWDYIRDPNVENEYDIKKIQFLTFCLTNRIHSKAQLLQDLYVMHKLNSKRDGFFVEFGATNGLDLSNTYLLEKMMGWKGILAEPFPVWHQALASNRNVHIDHRCVWKETGGKMDFLAVENTPEYAALLLTKDADIHASLRNESQKVISVDTVSLNELLGQYEAPVDFDYLSVDTEGAEYEILAKMDFNKYKPKIITVEHNYSHEIRDGVYKLLTKYGYLREFECFSIWDDWYYFAG